MQTEPDVKIFAQIFGEVFNGICKLTFSLYGILWYNLILNRVADACVFIILPKMLFLIFDTAEIVSHFFKLNVKFGSRTLLFNLKRAFSNSSAQMQPVTLTNFPVHIMV